jgi:hypothetical protein
MCTAPGYEGFDHFGGECFLFVDEPKTFDEADDDCKKKGAHLASINNIGAEWFTLNAIKSSDAWIGLSNKKVLFKNRVP